MNLRLKTLMVVGICLAISAVANFFVINMFVYPKFMQLEREAAKKDAQRAVEALSSELKQIELTSWDYSTWDETYNFVTGNHAGNYAEVNLRPESLKNVRMDVV